MKNKKYPPFQFKQFSIQQNSAAMKIGTDGILLGAWVKANNKKHGLDIGTGTGVIAIMQCQKNDTINMDAIDISKNAIADAEINFKNCPWKNRLSLGHKDLNKFQPIKKYDFIVSNPPYFKDSLKPENSERTKARHSASLDLIDIFNFCKTYLSKKGTLNLILPHDQANSCKIIAKQFNFHTSRECLVYPKPNKNPHRVLFEFQEENVPFQAEEIIIEDNGRHQYSKYYKKLTRDFYTIFE